MSWFWLGLNYLAAILDKVGNFIDFRFRDALHLLTAAVLRDEDRKQVYSHKRRATDTPYLWMVIWPFLLV